MFRFFLFLFPKEFRDEYGGEMTRLIRDRCRREGAVHVWLEVVPDLILTAAREHMHTFWKDILYTFRTLAKSPGFAAAAILSLALGIGANTAIFSVISGVLLNPLPYREPSRLMSLYEKRPQQGRQRNPVSSPDFVDWRKDNTVFEDLAAFSGARYTLTGHGEPQLVAIALVSANFFPVLGIQPQLGRSFLPEEETTGKNRVILLGHELWVDRFGADPDIVGRTIALSDKAFQVIGVLPPLSDLIPQGAGAWAPLVLLPNDPRGLHFLNVIGRVKAGVPLARVRSEMEAIGARLQQEHPAENTGHTVNVFPLEDEVVGKVRNALWMLLGAVSLVLLIACSNVANLFLARTSQRLREISIRRALGAGTARLVRQLLTESLLLSLIAGALGVGFAVLAVHALVAANPGNLPRLHDIRVDPSVLLFTTVASLLTGILVGLAPAFFTARTSLGTPLKEGARGSTDPGARSFARGALVVVEVALALMLTVGAGLMMQSFVQLANVDPGFDPGGILAADIPLVTPRYAREGAKWEFFRDYMNRLRALPGVISTGATTALPLSGRDSGSNFLIEGRPVLPYSQQANGRYRAVTPGYFETMRIRLQAGRYLDDRDSAKAPLALVINETMARQFWQHEQPVGRRIRLSGEKEWREIVGVVGDVKHYALDGEVRPEMYFPFAQAESSALTVVVRTAGSPESLMSGVRAQLAAIDKDQPISSLQTLDQLVSTSVAQPRLYSALLAAFSTLAMALAGVGIYGLLSFSVGHRLHEIGIRMALGASSRSVQAMVLKQGMALALIGVAVGTAGAFALTRVMREFLFGITATDTATFGAAAVLVVLIAAAACYFPARRATRIDPMIALRCD